MDKYSSIWYHIESAKMQNYCSTVRLRWIINIFIVKELQGFNFSPWREKRMSSLEYGYEIHFFWIRAHAVFYSKSTQDFEDFEHLIRLMERK